MDPTGQCRTPKPARPLRRIVPQGKLGREWMGMDGDLVAMGGLEPPTPAL